LHTWRAAWRQPILVDRGTLAHAFGGRQNLEAASVRSVIRRFWRNENYDFHGEIRHGRYDLRQDHPT
jgi:hypothetical protein